MLKPKKDDELILHDVFGAIAYKGEGIFIAGGAGVTPFICIFRYLQSKKKIGTKYGNWRITESFLKANSDSINQNFYVCGPPPMMEEVEKQLIQLKVNEKHIIKEEF